MQRTDSHLPPKWIAPQLEIKCQIACGTAMFPPPASSIAPPTKSHTVPIRPSSFKTWCIIHHLSFIPICFFVIYYIITAFHILQFLLFLFFGRSGPTSTTPNTCFNRQLLQKKKDSSSVPVAEQPSVRYLGRGALAWTGPAAEDFGGLPKAWFNGLSAVEGSGRRQGS